MQRSQIKQELEAAINRDDISDNAKKDISRKLNTLLSPLETDVIVYRIVVSLLGLVALITVLGPIIVSLANKATDVKDMPDGIIAIGSAAIGALAGLLAPNPNRN